MTPKCVKRLSVSFLITWLCWCKHSPDGAAESLQRFTCQIKPDRCQFWTLTCIHKKRHSLHWKIDLKIRCRLTQMRIWIQCKLMLEHCGRSTDCCGEPAQWHWKRCGVTESDAGQRGQFRPPHGQFFHNLSVDWVDLSDSSMTLSFCFNF